MPRRKAAWVVLLRLLVGQVVLSCWQKRQRIITGTEIYDIVEHQQSQRQNDYGVMLQNVTICQISNVWREVFE
jgi:hypothetical protein